MANDQGITARKARNLLSKYLQEQGVSVDTMRAKTRDVFGIDYVTVEVEMASLDSGKRQGIKDFAKMHGFTVYLFVGPGPHVTRDGEVFSWNPR